MKFIREYWFLIVFIGSSIAMWTTMSNNVNNISYRVTKLETIQDSNSAILLQIQTRLASIETSLEFIKNQIK